MSLYIVQTTLMSAKINRNITIIVGEVVDILVIQTAQTPPILEIFFIKPEKGITEQNIYSSTSLDGIYKEHILFLHVFSGCDGASAIFQKRRSVLMKLLEKHPEL